MLEVTTITSVALLIENSCSFRSIKKANILCPYCLAAAMLYSVIEHFWHQSDSKVSQSEDCCAWVREATWTQISVSASYQWAVLSCSFSRFLLRLSLMIGPLVTDFYSLASLSHSFFAARSAYLVSF